MNDNEIKFLDEIIKFLGNIKLIDLLSTVATFISCYYAYKSRKYADKCRNYNQGVDIIIARNEIEGIFKTLNDLCTIAKPQSKKGRNRILELREIANKLQKSYNIIREKTDVSFRKDMDNILGDRDDNFNSFISQLMAVKNQEDGFEIESIAEWKNRFEKVQDKLDEYKNKIYDKVTGLE